MPTYMLSQATKDKLAILLGSSTLRDLLNEMTEELSHAEPQLFELQDNLVPGYGSEIDGKLVKWNHYTGLYEVTTDIEKVKDVRLNAWGLKYEWVQCKKVFEEVEGGQTAVNEIVTPGAPMYEGTLQGILNQGSFANANVTVRGAVVSVVAYDRLLLSGDSLATSTRIILQPDVNSHRYTVTGATCPV